MSAYNLCSFLICCSLVTWPAQCFQTSVQEPGVVISGSLPRQLYLDILVFYDDVLLELAEFNNNIEVVTSYIKSWMTEAHKVLSKVSVNVIVKDVMLLAQGIITYDETIINPHSTGGLVDQFVRYVYADRAVLPSFDAALLFTGIQIKSPKLPDGTKNGDFENGAYFPSGVCGVIQGGYVAVLKTDKNDNSILKTKSTLATTVSHVLAQGMGVTVDYGRCRQDCIMCGAPWNASCNHDAISLENKWSTCSADKLKSRAYKCAIEKPLPGKISICGNSVVEAGEECDCLRYDMKCRKCCAVERGCKKNTDKACKPVRPVVPPPRRKCKLGRCCRNNVVAETGEVCGDIYDECDLGEICDGTSEYGCVPSERPNNTPCSKGRESGICISGVCRV